uniref:Family with sequence similarity 149, member B1 n=1 Tax=Nothobranchius kadleci TaxID=1051664 RepID=A0A1A8C1H3_NOTKA
MISRYNRKPVSHKLEIRGLSHSRLDHHPLPEEPNDNPVPHHHLRDLQEAVSAHNSSQTSSASGHSACPTVISSVSNQSWSGIHSATGTGISTERSSVFSWGYDEFDKAASRQVQQMFDEIDTELYEGRGSGGGVLQGLQDECQQWTTRFPHLRRELDGECVDDSSQLVRRHRCLPPVSPYRCRRQAVLDLLFDDVWRELVGWMKELVQRHWECCTSHDETISGSLSPVPSDSHDPFILLSTPPTLLPKLGQNWVPLLTAGQQGSFTVTQAGRTSVGAAAARHNLNDLITIHSIPLQQRNQDPEERASLRPGSSAVPSSKPRPRRVLEQSSSSLSRPPQSARRRNPPPRTLLPLVPSSSQSSAGVYLDEVIRGTRLTTASDRLTSPLLPLSRSTPLPPISIGESESHSGQQSKLAQRVKGHPSRAHSAINNEAGGSLPRDRHHLLDVFSRPNTTHTYRSDTPYRSSFTVLDNIGQGRPGRTAVGTDSLGIGVTGISLGISSSSFLDSFPHHPLGHAPIRDEEEPEPQVPAPLVPVSGPPRYYTRGSISSRAGRPGL